MIREREGYMGEITFLKDSQVWKIGLARVRG